MKALFEKIPLEEASALRVYDYETDQFDAPWHFHPEFELTLIVKSNGTRYVGNNIEPFGPLDLVMTGPNMPHLWKNSSSYPGKKPLPRAVVVHFTRESFGKGFFDRSEMKRISQLMELSLNGIHFNRDCQLKVFKLLLRLGQQEPFDRILSFLNIMNQLANFPGVRQLSGANFSPKLHNLSADRINTVCQFVFNNFADSITLGQLSELARMTPNAFSRYFNQMMGLSPIRFVNQVRVENACKLLMESDLNVTQICYECGFNSISNFNKRFKDIMNSSPVLFREEHL